MNKMTAHEAIDKEHTMYPYSQVQCMTSDINDLVQECSEAVTDLREISNKLLQASRQVDLNVLEKSGMQYIVQELEERISKVDSHLQGIEDRTKRL